MKRERFALALIALSLVSGMLLMAATSGSDSKQKISPSASVSND